MRKGNIDGERLRKEGQCMAHAIDTTVYCLEKHYVEQNDLVHLKILS